MYETREADHRPTASHHPHQIAAIAIILTTVTTTTTATIFRRDLALGLPKRSRNINTAHADAATGVLTILAVASHHVQQKDAVR